LLLENHEVKLRCNAENQMFRGVALQSSPTPLHQSCNSMRGHPGGRVRDSPDGKLVRPISCLEFFQQKASRFSNLSNIRQVISLGVTWHCGGKIRNAPGEIIRAEPPIELGYVRRQDVSRVSNQVCPQPSTLLVTPCDTFDKPVISQKRCNDIGGTYLVGSVMR